MATSTTALHQKLRSPEGAAYARMTAEERQQMRWLFKLLPPQALIMTTRDRFFGSLTNKDFTFTRSDAEDNWTEVVDEETLEGWTFKLYDSA